MPWLFRAYRIRCKNGSNKKDRVGEGVVGNDLLSHTVTHILPSARAGLTAGFGMGPGVPPPLISPTNISPAPVLYGLCWSQLLKLKPVLLVHLLVRFVLAGAWLRTCAGTLKTKQD
jgi:hypothetical protein